MNDRIAQMAREVGFDEYEAAALYRHLARFARLVAEDCAAHVERKMTEGRSPLGKVAANFVRERYSKE
jgi:hypothetical protein